MLIKEQNNSNQSSLSIDPNGFLSSSIVIYLYCLLKKLLLFWLIKLFDF